MIHCTLGETYLEFSATRAACRVNTERTKNRQNMYPCLVLASTPILEFGWDIDVGSCTDRSLWPSTAPMKQIQTHLLSDTV